MIKILLDAGHDGKYNQSPVVKTYYESDFTFNMVELMKKYLLENFDGIQVDTTRKKQTDKLEPYDRGKKAKGYDILISIHSNACGTESVDRAVVIHTLKASTKDKEFAIKLADVMTKEIGLKDKRQTYSKESGTTKGKEYYGLLRGAVDNRVQSAFIVEHGFHTNKACTTKLLQDNIRTKLVESECEAIATHYKLDRKSKHFTVRVTDTLPIRKDASKDSKKVGDCGKGVYTITSEKNGFGTLLSGAGWINLSHKNVQKK